MLQHTAVTAVLAYGTQYYISTDYSMGIVLVSTLHHVVYTRHIPTFLLELTLSLVSDDVILLCYGYVTVLYHRGYFVLKIC